MTCMTSREALNKKDWTQFIEDVRDGKLSMEHMEFKYGVQARTIRNRISALRKEGYDLPTPKSQLATKQELKWQAFIADWNDRDYTPEEIMKRHNLKDRRALHMRSYRLRKRGYYLRVRKNIRPRPKKTKAPNPNAQHRYHKTKAPDISHVKPNIVSDICNSYDRGAPMSIIAELNDMPIAVIREVLVQNGKR